MLLIKILLKKWNYGVILEKIVFSTRTKTEEHMLIVMHKCIHKEHFSQPIQTIKKQLKIAVTFVSG